MSAGRPMALHLRSCVESCPPHSVPELSHCQCVCHPWSKSNREAAALEAGTHIPAVDDFGNQYLARVTPERLPGFEPT